MSNALLLDTHVWIWYAEGRARQLSYNLLAAIEQARLDNCLYVSTISVWEIGMLCAKEKISLSAPVSEWIRRGLRMPGLRLLLLDAETALESTQLPDRPHGDPADRFLIAAARIHGLRLVTADRKITEYGKVGHAQILAI
ncbi:MAG: type II toxin-antitoxin system VapC family toxin [Acidiferrobacter sp.]